MIWQSIIAKTTIWKSFNKEKKSSNSWIIFNWYNLLDCSSITSEGNYDDINAVQLDTYNAPRTDWGWTLGYYINGKQIEFKMIIKQDTEEELNNAIDDLKKNLAVKNWILEIEINGLYRKWEAYLTALSFNRNFENKTIQSDVTVSFNMTNHFYSETTDSYTESWITGNDLALDINNEGTTSCFYKLAFIFSSWNSWVSNIKIEQDWYSLEINETISDWDILLVDWVDKEVTINTNMIDYDWVFTELQTGSNPILISINGSPNVDITVLFNKNYL